MIDQAVARADRFDIPHFHIDFLQFPLARLLDVPTVTTLHGRLDLPDLAPFHSSVAKAPLVSISDSRRAPMPPVAWAGRFPHGLPKDPLPFSPEERRGYLAFAGRICPEERPYRAIENLMVFHRPVVPDVFDEVTPRNLTRDDASLDVALRRSDGGLAMTVFDRTGGVRVATTTGSRHQGRQVRLGGFGKPCGQWNSERSANRCD